MKHILLAWELGGGFGHLDRMKTLAACLLNDGYQVTVATCDLIRTQNYFSSLPVHCIQSPLCNISFPHLAQTPAYVHILYNAGYGDSGTLQFLISGWKQLFNDIHPDILIADHAPTALLVARDFNIPRINFGDGFTCPPPSKPLPFLSQTADREQVGVDEELVLQYCNRALYQEGLSPLSFLGELYQVDETFLLTVPELDHLGKRYQVHYCGGLPAEKKGCMPIWPVAYGRPRVFVYLQQFDELGLVLDLLARSSIEALVYIEGLPPSLQCAYQYYEHLRFSDQPVNVHSVLMDADLVISHGGHQMMLQTATAGIPQLHIPVTLEQQLLAFRCSLSGASLYGFADQIEAVLAECLASLTEKRANADSFSNRVSVYGSNPLGRCLALVNYYAHIRPAQKALEETEIWPEYTSPTEGL
ncbi:hypothetical protein M3P05_10880 [Sansalvadorimonas sp. 2012CJ34-2]|uniref:Glycosyl transferase family 28 C-terminal domain-containing protein n=1 Tax=Parendozoicomonas callyspongiae TaxID=2942213 RepID=A0ABT0PGB4_9GAMM|nr:glycosyltransferase [Sansalvadorimonas sp. 2012CJ34-2]MCL6270424.1 hypothetical protein [Sansalvadorimonas sp. 2012CJ34-2]